jgi:hypothetical protein
MLFHQTRIHRSSSDSVKVCEALKCPSAVLRRLYKHSVREDATVLQDGKHRHQAHQRCALCIAELMACVAAPHSLCSCDLLYSPSACVLCKFVTATRLTLTVHISCVLHKTDNYCMTYVAINLIHTSMSHQRVQK